MKAVPPGPGDNGLQTAKPHFLGLSLFSGNDHKQSSVGYDSS